MAQPQKHFVIVHGACHGAWCWYKLIPLLKSAGYEVTALDLAAAGINTQKVTEIFTLRDHSAPLLDFVSSLPPEDKVILVGHSFGGLNIALAMEMYPNKILLGVFLSAIMPNVVEDPTSANMNSIAMSSSQEGFLDSQFITYGNPESPETAILFGPKHLEMNLYQLSPVEDLELAYLTVRPSSLLTRDSSLPFYFSNEGYGSVKRAYIMTPQDRAITLDFQRRLIENFSVDAVKKITDADHMSMFSNAQKLSQLLIELANKYS